VPAARRPVSASERRPKTSSGPFVLAELGHSSTTAPGPTPQRLNSRRFTSIAPLKRYLRSEPAPGRDEGAMSRMRRIFPPLAPRMRSTAGIDVFLAHAACSWVEIGDRQALSSNGLLDARQGRHGLAHADRAQSGAQKVGRRVLLITPSLDLAPSATRRRVPASGHQLRLGRRHLARFIEPSATLRQPLELSPKIASTASAASSANIAACASPMRSSEPIPLVLVCKREAHSFRVDLRGHPTSLRSAATSSTCGPGRALTSRSYRFRARPGTHRGRGKVCTFARRSAT